MANWDNVEWSKWNPSTEDWSGVEPQICTDGNIATDANDFESNRDEDTI